MRKKYYRYFFGFLDLQEKWLNKMAADGYRLIHATKLAYEFESCSKGKYQYCVEFVGEKSNKEAKDYRQFLEELGFRTFMKNINLNYSFGKVRLRPWAKGMGKIATSPGSYNKELLILEKKNDGNPFELHTDAYDLVQYYQPIRNIYLSIVFLILILSIWGFVAGNISMVSQIIFALFGALLMIPVVKYSILIHHLKKESKIQE